MLRALCVLVLFSACGSVSPAAGVDGAGSAGGAAGDGATAGAAGTGGAGGTTSAAGAGGSSSAGTTGAAGVSGTGGAAGAPACLPFNTQGFAYNPSCGDGGTTLPRGCHASCELNGAHYVGCAVDPSVDGGAVLCRASCSDCP